MTDPFVFVLLMMLLPSTSVLITALLRRWAVRSDGSRLGLQQDERSEHVDLRGQVEGCRVRVTAQGVDPSGKSGIQILVQGDERLAPGVRLSRENFIRGPGSTELQLGAERFDRQAYLEGPDDVVAAMLTDAAREALLTLMQGATVVVCDGHVEITLVSPRWTRVLDPTVRGGVRLYKELAMKGLSIADRLLHNAVYDPVTAVCVTNLKLLLTHHADTPAGQRGLELAAATRDPELLLLRAQALHEGKAEALGAFLLDSEMPTELRLGALREGAGLDAAFEAQLAQALHACEGELRGAVARAVGDGGHRSMLPLLHELAAEQTDAAAEGFCRAFAALRDERAEPHLLRFLQDPAHDTQVQAAHALAQVGGVMAVQPLLQLSSGLLRAPTLKSAARQAVQAIQARLHDADVGDLSLVSPEPDAGELSLAHEAGEVALAHDDSTCRSVNTRAPGPSTSSPGAYVR